MRGNGAVLERTAIERGGGETRETAPALLAWGREIANWERASALEWLETNGLGGYASGTVAGANSRRYHGLLVAATEPPVGREVLLAKLDETIAVDGERFELGCNQYPGAVQPRGCERLVSFTRDLFPVWEYEAGGARLRKTVVARHGENTTLVLYELLAAPGPVRLELRPFLAGRDFHAMLPRGFWRWRERAAGEGRFWGRSRDFGPELYLEVAGARFEEAPDWYYQFEYHEEQRRGFDYREDLFTPGLFSLELSPGGRVAVVASTSDPGGCDPWSVAAAEAERRERLFPKVKSNGPVLRALLLAADQYLAKRGRDGATVIAGYPWFADWGRDTMIALPGLCLATGRLEEAQAILGEFAGAVDQGMLPNRFPDRGEAPEYNTVDATLWLFVALDAYLAAGGDRAFARERMLPVLREILAWHRRGTRHGIRVDGDGLLAAGEAGVQLTWMDAKVGDWVVTPRHGKPVEIQALWYNALHIAGDLERALAGDEARAVELEAQARRVQERFVELFWNEELGHLADVVDGERRDFALRPNQLFALGLPFPLLEGERAARALAAVEQKLLTPRGLRTLSPDDAAYRPRYEGGPAERDGAYHQGTVWPWLLGIWGEVVLRVRGRAARGEVLRRLAEMVIHLSEAGVGSISEIFDGAPPHRPAGCPAQAWSVSELIRLTLLVRSSR